MSSTDYRWASTAHLAASLRSCSRLRTPFHQATALKKLSGTRQSQKETMTMKKSRGEGSRVGVGRGEVEVIVIGLTSESRQAAVHGGFQGVREGGKEYKCLVTLSSSSSFSHVAREEQCRDDPVRDDC
jgi:hypothetical protein